MHRTKKRKPPRNYPNCRSITLLYQGPGYLGDFRYFEDFFYGVYCVICMGQRASNMMKERKSPITSPSCVIPSCSGRQAVKKKPRPLLGQVCTYLSVPALPHSL